MLLHLFLISATTLYLTIFKIGKPVISIIKNEFIVSDREVKTDDRDLSIVSYSANIIFTVIIKNSGANETAFSQLTWTAEDYHQSFNIQIIDSGTSEQFMEVKALKPYGHKFEKVKIGIYIKYKDIDQVKKDRITIGCIYNWYKSDQVKKVTSKYDLTDVLVRDINYLVI